MAGYRSCLRMPHQYHSFDQKHSKVNKCRSEEGYFHNQKTTEKNYEKIHQFT